MVVDQTHYNNLMQKVNQEFARGRPLSGGHHLIKKLNLKYASDQTKDRRAKSPRKRK